jgi:hypothetical protein
MTENVADLIRAKAARLKEVLVEAAQLRLELDEIRSAVGDVVPEQPKRRKRGKPAARAEKGARPVKPGSNIAAAVEVLNAAGRPLHIDALLPEVEAITGKKISKATLVGQLAEYYRKGMLISRPETSTYGLKAWENKVVALKREPVIREEATM